MDDQIPASKTLTYEMRVKACSPIARPLASEKLNMKILKLIQKASSAKTLKRGVRDTVKAISRGQKGLAVIAGDIFPIDVISHIPVLCEDMDVPYIYVPSKEELGFVSVAKRPTTCVLLSGTGSPKYETRFKAIYEKVLDLNKKMSGL